MNTGKDRMKWLVVGLAVQLAMAGAALAADSGVEFGAEDDLTVLGTGGNLQDADLEIKGFSVFGTATGLAVPDAFTNGPGSVVVSSNLFVGGQLKAGSIDLSGADMTVSNLTVQGAFSAQGSSLNIMTDATMQKSLSVGSNLTVTGAATLGSLGVTGNQTVGGTLGVTGATTLDALSAGAATLSSLGVTGATSLNTLSTTGNGSIGGTLGVTGAATLGDTLNVTGTTTLGTLSAGASTLSSVSVTGNGAVGGTLGVTGAVTIDDTTESTSTSTGALIVKGGAGIAKNANVGGALGVTGNATVGGTLAVTDVATLSTNITAQQSAFLATSGGAVGVGNSAPDANTKMQVTGGDTSGDYVAKFYSGSTLAAWIKKK